MADVICRWRNTTPQTVVELVNSMPHEEMDSQSFRVIMNESMYGERFLHTAYQLACQLGLYYEDGTMFHPRFDHDITEEEATVYIQKWIHRYYAPNPYTKKLTALKYPILLVESIVKKIEENGTTDLKEILEDLFKQEMGNLDIVQNLLNVYSNVVSIKDGQVSLKENYKEYMEKFIDKNDKAAFFHAFDDEKEAKPLVDSLQRIYYGAPGVGKSYEVKKETNGKSVVRTTFHPDSDYSTFVGAYKPTTKDVPMRDVTGKIIHENGKEVTENRIIYRFVPQAFLQAYIEAWKNYPNPQYLVIEEINRGNCAQIFGDLFQLLDRNEDGFSEYPIKADNDISNYILGENLSLETCELDDTMKSKIRSGELLLLPKNLYIWATMNTSDQSLFPIDSAFKRRWDWKYMRIKDAGKEWRISAGNSLYDWWDFVQKINKHIYDTTNSADKQLGYFFCKAGEGKVLTAETFVNKVVFYLWNDVFKDYGFDDAIFNDDKDEKGDNSKDAKLTFDNFFDKENESIDESKVGKFLDNLGVVKVVGANTLEDDTLEDEEDSEETLEVHDGESSTPNGSQRDYSKYSINGVGNYNKRTAVRRVIEMYVGQNPQMTGEQIINVWRGLNLALPNAVESEAEYLAHTANDSVKRGNPIQVNENDVIYVSNQLNVERMNDFISKVNQQDWGIHIEKISD